MGDNERYERAFLLYLKDSPQCVRPKDLPPKEDYMGAPAEAIRPAPKTTTERPFASLANEQGSRRHHGVDRHGNRNGTSDGLVLGPPRSNFSSTSRSTPGDLDRNDKTPLDSEFRDRFLRGKMGAIGGGTEPRAGRSTHLRGRDEPEREGEGWSKVKPRRSFGQDGAASFTTGRMGGDHRTQRDDRGKERDEHDGAKERRRPLDADGDDADGPRRNGQARAKTEPWFKETTAKPVDPAERALNRERIEKAKSWRPQDPEDKSGHPRGGRERNSERYDRRWDREQREPRQEREPEWMDEPVEEKHAAHTEADLKKFMDRARAGTKAAETPAEALDGLPGLPAFFNADSSAVRSAPAAEQRPDPFISKFSGETVANTLRDNKAEAINVQPTKSSKFANFFSVHSAPQQTEAQGCSEPSTPAAGLPPPANGGGLVGPQTEAEKMAFSQLLKKLQLPPAKPQGTPTPPNTNAGVQPPPPQQSAAQSPNVAHDHIGQLAHALDQKANLGSPDRLHAFGLGRPEEPRLRSVPPPRPEIMAPRPMPPPSQLPSARHDQLFFDILARNNTQSQGSGRVNPADPQTVQLMQLMQQQQQMPDQRAVDMRQQAPRQPAMSQFEPEAHYLRDHGPPQQRQMQPLASYDNLFRRSEGDGRIIQQQQQQPMPHPHILPRQQMIPPGLEHGVPLQQQMWPGQQQPPPGQRQGPMIPQPPQMQLSGRAPPGLPFGAAMGSGPVVSGLPPNMLQQSADTMPGLMRGGMVQPPPGFFSAGPPPPPPLGGPGGFLPPPGMGGPFPGPDGPYFSHAPYDGRGAMPPPGGAPFRR